MNDTVTIPQEIPREIVHEGKKLKVVGFELRVAQPGEWIWVLNRWRPRSASTQDIWLIAITAPVPEHWEPTPVEALKAAYEAGGKLQCQRVDGTDTTLALIDLRPGEPLPFCVPGSIGWEWVSKIRIVK